MFSGSRSDIRRRDLRNAPASQRRQRRWQPHLVVVAPQISFQSGRNAVEICDIYHDLECCISPKMPTHLYPIKIHSPDEDNQIASQWLVGTTPNDESKKKRRKCPRREGRNNGRLVSTTFIIDRRSRAQRCQFGPPFPHDCTLNAKRRGVRYVGEC